MNQTEEIKFELQYSECCETYRHYSSNIKEIRTVSIAQGIIALTGSGYLLQNKSYTGAIFVVFFGILLTLTLWRIHKSYYRNAINYLNYIADNLEKQSGPWSNHKRLHAKRSEKYLSNLILKDGVFILFLISNILLAIGIYLKVKL